MSGYLGLNCDIYTLREFWEMVEGKQEQEWGHTSQLMSYIHNGNCSKKKDMRTASFFNPFATVEQKRLKRPDDVLADVTIFKKLLPLAKKMAKDKRNKPSTVDRKFIPPKNVEAERLDNG